MVTSSGKTITERDLSGLAAHLRLVITRTARRLRQQAGTGLGPSQISALASIERHGPLTPSELAEIERIQRPSATRIVARLEEAELVERVVDPTDRRSFTVGINAAGRALMNKHRTRKNAYLAKRLRGLDEADLATLDRAAEILEDLLEGERR
ncbi:MAG TPA: MarR family transcriptional regulator [Solirubrobacterales bacterium]|nr:MarR family transcriptional regulator [Solirubrobacterales bacterium]